MDVSLRQWPIFVTGLLLGAAGTMSLGLHRLTEAERAAMASKAAPANVVAVATPAEVPPDAGIAERADEQMRAAAQAFRAQELLAAASVPPPKPRVRQVVKEPELTTTAIATDLPNTIAPVTAPEPVERPRLATSVMGSAPMEQHVEAARGSAHALETGPPSE